VSLSRIGHGHLGEDLAAERLRQGGYTIVERNVRSRYGEIDLVAKDGECVVFVEVRTMASGMMAPEESVTGRKQRRVVALSLRYLQDHGMTDADWRADVVAIEMGQDGKPVRFEHYVNAVEA